MSIFPKNSQDRGKLDTVSSDSDPSKQYEIRIGKDNVIYCGCPGWAHSKKTPKMCRHLAKWVFTHSGQVMSLLTDRLGDIPGEAAADALIEAATSYNGRRK